MGPVRFRVKCNIVTDVKDAFKTDKRGDEIAQILIQTKCVVGLSFIRLRLTRELVGCSARRKNVFRSSLLRQIPQV